MPLTERSAGVLLHITSLPGPHGIGDLGPEAFNFIDWLASAGQRIWQVLPTNPIGPGHSPYQSVSAFAGSPLMVALEPLQAKGWLEETVLPPGGFDAARVDFAHVVPWRLTHLRAAARGFFARADGAERRAFANWCLAQADWLDAYALFMTLETHLVGRPWWQWPTPLRERDPQALAEAAREHAAEIGFWRFVQWCFDVQWAAMKAHANARGIALMGDLPIFIAHHSADCWARPDMYELDADRQPTVVAGVPPDAFSVDGQLWGNPLYRWSRMADDGFVWWTKRVQRALMQADVFRIDHFRGFAACWEVPAGSATAANGRWVEGPGRALFDAITAALGALPIVAEDLGLITPDVIALRDGCGFPGMRILQFAFGGDGTHEFLPHNVVPASVIYTGTHDNDTVQGWWAGVAPHERRFVAAYVAPFVGNEALNGKLKEDATDAARAAHTDAAGTVDIVDIVDVHWALIRAACNSVARTAIFPMQDVLGLDATHRMNTPGTAEGNWEWRFAWDRVGSAPGRTLGAIAAASGRGPFALLT